MNGSSTESTAQIENLSKAQEWLVDYSKDVYDAFSKIDSINERVRTLTAPMTALGAGYIYLLTNYKYSNGTVDALFFYLPIGIGALLIISAIFLMLWALVVKHMVELLADPMDVLKAVKQQMDGPLWTIEQLAIERRCKAASQNINSIKQRCKLLRVGAWMAIAAFALLIFSTPKFVHSKISAPTLQNAQR